MLGANSAPYQHVGSTSVAEKKVSKNQRSSVGTAGSYTELGEMARIVPLGAGHCYLRSPLDGRTHRVKVNSEAFDTLLGSFAEKVGSPRLVTELKSLHETHPTHGFDVAAKKLAEAQAS